MSWDLPPPMGPASNVRRKAFALTTRPSLTTLLNKHERTLICLDLQRLLNGYRQH